MATKDIPPYMSWPVGDNVLTATRHDPYGFWRFSFKRGQLPNSLLGDFTAESKVINAAEAYISIRKDK